MHPQRRSGYKFIFAALTGIVFLVSFSFIGKGSISNHEKKAQKIPVAQSKPISPQEINQWIKKMGENDLLDMVSLSLLAHASLLEIADKKVNHWNDEKKNMTIMKKKSKKQVCKPIHHPSHRDIKQVSSDIHGMERDSVKPSSKSPEPTKEHKPSRSFDYNDQLFHQEE